MGSRVPSRVTAVEPDSRPRARRTWIDWARGLAVLAMIEAHAIDAWTRAADRDSLAFTCAHVVGGCAAPLFLWLAGMSMALSADAAARRQGSRAGIATRVCRRGLEILVLAFLFRLQAFVLSPGSHAIMLFRVDILNVMGPAIALAAWLWGATTSTGVLVATYAVGAAAFAMLAPVVRTTPSVDVLPLFAQWYIRPAGEYTTFTLFPWAGFVLGGAAVGVLLARRRNEHDARLQAAMAAAGVAVMAVGFCMSILPSLFRESSFWTNSPTYFAIRVGGLMVALPALWALERILAQHASALAPLERIGRSSLFVYWIHVELVYGYASWLWRGHLPLAATLVAYAVFSALMYGAILLRDRVVMKWRTRRTPQQPAVLAI